MSAPNEKFAARVHSITWAAEGICIFELRPLSGGTLPPHTAGAHIDLHLPNGLVRSYSLVNPQGETHRYLFAVSRDAASRGGSRYLLDVMRVGETVMVGAPRNNFRLVEDAPHSVFIAGGIGITPLWCMMQRMAELGRSWQLYYATRTRQHAAFLDEINALGQRTGAQVHIHFDQAAGGRPLDLHALVQAVPRDAHLYCCGPQPMLAAFELACAQLSKAQVHVEYFSAPSAVAATGGFNVVLTRSGKSVFVAEGKSILDALLEAGVDVPFSCSEGVCGACETRVLGGVPDHRDVILTEADKEARQSMMICCSGSKSEELLLDL
jgi:ferredoxin-NADP reductase